jgi:hypothetical protein
MDTFACELIAEQAAKNGAKFRVFDWNKAATLIHDREPKRARAGLARDMENTAGVIYKNGETFNGIDASDYGCYLASNWAVPVLELDGKEIDCWIWEFNEGGDYGHDWNEYTRWPQSALDILNGDG